MARQILKIVQWNANGLASHSQELKAYANEHDVDIILISETHFTRMTYFKIHKYTTYTTNHPDGGAHGGAAVIIKNTIKHYELPQFNKDFLQGASVVIEDWRGPITISALYCPPKHSIKKEQFVEYFNSLGNRFIAGGDYNAKNVIWGSSKTLTRGRELLKAMQANNLRSLSTGQPTYWPTDRGKTPDLIDFCVVRNIADTYLTIDSSCDLSSDHSPIIITLNSRAIERAKPPSIYNKRTDWEKFKELLDENIPLDLRLKTEEDVDIAVERLNKIIQEAAWQATPPVKDSERKYKCSIDIRKQIAEKRKLRKQWQITRNPADKTILNKATNDLKKALNDLKNDSIQNYLQGLTATSTTNYSLWKATKKMNRPQQHVPPIRKPDGTWARNCKEKASVFAEHLTKVFQPYPSELPQAEESEITEFLEAPFQLDLPMRKFKKEEVISLVQNMNTNKAPGYDLITGKILKQLTKKCITLITMIFNASITLGHFPSQWKVAQIILIPKPGKKPEDVSSYRPISLLPTLSKLFEKLLLKRIKPILMKINIIPNHQFGFRNKHSTIEQVHRVIRSISDDLEAKRYCSAAFLDISQAFDKVWHAGLLYKLKKNLPHNLYQILKSYLSNRFFQVKFEDELTHLHEIQSGVPQGSVLGPVLYLIYTADLPRTPKTTVATFADDTTVLASDTDPNRASMYLQCSLNRIQNWLKKWRIKANESKSTHVTFTLRRGNCPPVVLNSTTIPQADVGKYLGIYLDRRLTWQKHIWAKRLQVGRKFSQMYWLLGRRSALSIDNKLLLYKTIIKPIWTYGAELWGSASISNINRIQRFQNKTLRAIVDAPRYVPNWLLHEDLQVLTVKEEISRASARYQMRLGEHPNRLAGELLNRAEGRRLKRCDPLDIINRFDKT